MIAATATQTTFNPNDYEWVIRQYGDKSPEPYVGPADHDTVQGIVRSWNEHVDAYNTKHEGARRPSFYMQRADQPHRKL